MAFAMIEEIHPDQNPVVNFVKRFFPGGTWDLGHFYKKNGEQRLATPLFIALVVVETTDIMFAVDSIPAIFAITTDPFLVFTSNIFAILGLRSYFVLASILDKFYYIKYSLGFHFGFCGFEDDFQSHQIHLSGMGFLCSNCGSLAGGDFIFYLEKNSEKKISNLLFF
ncbi:MAG: hypothetical protein R2769_14300 [Saprospiraceae bacterium]